MNDFIDKIIHVMDDQTHNLSLHPRSVIRNIPGWSSLKVVAVIMMIDLEYGVLLTNSDINECTYVEDLYELISKEAV